MIKALQGSTPGVLLTRILVAAIVVFSTYNPSGFSAYHWVMDQPSKTDAWVILVIIVMLLINFALVIAAWKALGMIGTVVVLILFAAVTYLTLQEGWADTGNADSIQWLALILYSVFLGIGLAGAIIWRRATGQVVTDEADDIE